MVAPSIKRIVLQGPCQTLHYYFFIKREFTKLYGTYLKNSNGYGGTRLIVEYSHLSFLSSYKSNNKKLYKFHLLRKV